MSEKMKTVREIQAKVRELQCNVESLTALRFGITISGARVNWKMAHGNACLFIPGVLAEEGIPIASAESLARHIYATTGHPASNKAVLAEACEILKSIVESAGIRQEYLDDAASFLAKHKETE